MTGEPYIPEFITVHLGAPDQAAQNVTVTFPDYIKNVASSEIYPTWPENAIRANIYAQISFALNRYYTEWYRSQGYDFDITNSTRYDQAFVPNRVIYDNINAIVDDIFNSYVRRQGYVEPYFTQYCNGTTVTCEGLSQWGTVPLAEQGMSPYEILTYFYGDDIDIVRNAPVMLPTPSYPGTPLRLGSSGNDVQAMQVRLNRISRNYPGIPKIPVTDGLFDQATDRAVRAFQQIFQLTPDGIIGNATWNRISYIYTAVKGLAELDSEGIALGEIPQQYGTDLHEGDTGNDVRVVQYFLAVIAYFYDTVPPLTVNGIYDQQTVNTVQAFQQNFGLPVTGVVDEETWGAIYRVYRGLFEDPSRFEGGVPPFGGVILREGSSGPEVELLQQYLRRIAETYTEVPPVEITGEYDEQTEAAVRAFQRFFGLPETGQVGAIVWDRIGSVYSDLVVGSDRREGQAPGYTLGEPAPTAT